MHTVYSDTQYANVSEQSGTFVKRQCFQTVPLLIVTVAGQINAWFW